MIFLDTCHGAKSALWIWADSEVKEGTGVGEQAGTELQCRWPCLFLGAAKDSLGRSLMVAVQGGPPRELCGLEQPRDQTVSPGAHSAPPQPCWVA